ncbi:hypothetical protein E2C01_055248 [Portunus trituberculatus]|uniref:Uncharacterized protein n=1 Tax=Portunus trituberculatus TaxID=210409 RepID=A0A5B7GU73_PORTR|nr:hypothetical protein [Portunus trituberculatus]
MPPFLTPRPGRALPRPPATPPHSFATISEETPSNVAPPRLLSYGAGRQAADAVASSEGVPG